MTDVSRRQLFLGAAALTGAQLPTPQPAHDIPGIEPCYYGVRTIFVAWRRYWASGKFMCLEAQNAKHQWKRYDRVTYRYGRMPHNPLIWENHTRILERVTLYGWEPFEQFSHDHWDVALIVNKNGRRLEYPTGLHEDDPAPKEYRRQATWGP